MTDCIELSGLWTVMALDASRGVPHVTLEETGQEERGGC